jgi:hypothetical protein
MINDPIVEEVQRVRSEMFEKCGNDLHRYFEFIRESEKQHGHRLIRSVEELRARRKSAAATESGASSNSPPSG